MTPEQAHQAVFAAVQDGRLPHPTTLTCTRCSLPAVVYHHHRGYADEYALDVVAMCRSHHGREHGEAISESLRGVPKTKSHRSNMSTAMSTDAYRAKLRVAHTGRKHTTESREKIRLAALEREKRRRDG